MNWQTQVYDFPLPMRYWLSPTNKKGLAILLHGFQDHAGSMLKRLVGPALEPRVQQLTTEILGV